MDGAPLLRPRQPVLPEPIGIRGVSSDHRGGIPPLMREQAELFHAQAPDWQLLEEAHRIERSFRFRNFREALTFVQEIGELAEAEGHHPNISFGWGIATIS